MERERETANYRRTIFCYNTGEDLRLRSGCFHVLTILLSNLRTEKPFCKLFLFHVTVHRREYGHWGNRTSQKQRSVTLFRVSITSWGLVNRGTNWFGFSILMAVLPACVTSSVFNH